MIENKNFSKNIKFVYDRNLTGYPFNNFNDGITKEQILNKIKQAILTLENRGILTKGKFLDLKSEGAEEFKNIYDSMFDILDNSHDVIKHNKEHSSIFKNENFIILINDFNHLKLVSCSEKSIEDCLEQLIRVHKYLDDILKFEFSENYGFVGPDLKKLGDSFTFICDLHLSNIKNKEIFTKFNEESTKDGLSIIKNKVPNNESNDLLVKLKISSNFKLSEKEILHKINNKIYNLHYLENNYNNQQIEHVNLDKLTLTKGQNEERHKNLIKAYKNSFEIYKFTHLPNNVTLNTVFYDNLNKVNNLSYYTSFHKFFDNFIEARMDKQVEKTDEAKLNKNILNFQKFDLYKLKELFYKNDTVQIKSIRILRNIEGFNLVKYLNKKERQEIEKHLNDKISKSGNYHFDSTNNTYTTDNNRINIRILDEDHLTFNLQLTGFIEGNQKIEEIERFLSIYKEVSGKLNYFGFNYQFDESLGFLTNDIDNLGAGLRLELKVERKKNLDLTLFILDKRAGFDIINNNEEEDFITVNCDLNTETSLMYIFEHLNKFLKIVIIKNEEYQDNNNNNNSNNDSNNKSNQIESKEDDIEII